MNESYVTLQGWVGGDVDVRDVGETQCASFRVGSTPRYNKGGTWVDGQTSWFTVNCWRGLGKNVARLDQARRRGGGARPGPGRRLGARGPADLGHLDRRRDLRRPRPQPGHQQLREDGRATPRDPREDEAVREMVHAYEPTARSSTRPASRSTRLPERRPPGAAVSADAESARTGLAP